MALVTETEIKILTQNVGTVGHVHSVTGSQSLDITR